MYLSSLKSYTNLYGQWVFGRDSLSAEMNKSSLSWGTKAVQFANNCRHKNISWTAGIFRTHTWEIVHFIPLDVHFVKSKLQFDIINLGSCVSLAEIKTIGSDCAGFSCKFVPKFNRWQGIRFESWQHSFVMSYINSIFIKLWLLLAQSLRNWKNLAWDDAFKVAEK